MHFPQVWASVTPLKFHRRRVGEPNVEISFLPREHGDGYKFDGPSYMGGTSLAHAFFPIFGGGIHMDEDEPWTFNTTRGKVAESQCSVFSN